MATSSTDEPRVLVVDDEAQIADLYQLRLEDTYEVLKAYDGTEAIAKADEPADVVTLDCRMPDINGA